MQVLGDDAPANQEKDSNFDSEDQLNSIEVLNKNFETNDNFSNERTSVENNQVQDTQQQQKDGFFKKYCGNCFKSLLGKSSSSRRNNNTDEQ